MEDIDWNNIESIFEEDDTYENINAPKWVDLSAPSQSIDDDVWFCKPGCNHPKSVEDYLKSKHTSKVKLLRSRTISEILPFRDRTRRETKAKTGERKGSKPGKSLKEDDENRNPNVSTPALPWTEEKTQRKKGLKSSLSGRNLVGGRDVLSQISELCAELKRMARKGSRKGAPEKASGGVLGEWKERVRERERTVRERQL
ncbi:hypothetical protein like AT3G52110 [Hibiscus trionum]|uniref:Uncharacterized protein n=1 Tax=Hibiscus trionum TaxID=183268 RepID=A0A9W7ITG0_HIBTR|nr:hypothetical protein like AT3G52110 [Hibiscus trionum]